MTSPRHELYVANAALIERAIGHVCRRHHVFGADADDFAGIVRMHLIDDDYAVLRQFQGRSSLRSYLLVVISRQFQDWRNARWGKWRPSAEARRLGDVAVRLETLTVRDGLSLDEAWETLRSGGASVSRTDVEALATRFPVRSRRTFMAEDSLDALPGDRRADEGVTASEAMTAARRATTALAVVLRELPAQDRLILKMRYDEGWQIAEIARVLHLDAKPLYRRVERTLADLRTRLEAAGLTSEQVAQAWSARGFDLLSAQESRADVRPFSSRAVAPALTGGPRE